jgi:hypothetical protein
MPPRYPLETTGGLDGAKRALARAGLDMESVEGRLGALESLPYSAATPADWSGSAPATVGEALDRLAAALGPIA